MLAISLVLELYIYTSCDSENIPLTYKYMFQASN
jgi:hypothetical protein